MIDGDPVNSLLFSFFALEAMLGNSAEGLKAHGLGYRRALLGRATRGSFPDPDSVYLLYDRVRSAAVHGEELPEVSEGDRDAFNADVRAALDEYLELAEKEEFETRKRLLRHLGELPEKSELDEWLIEFGDKTWARFLSREEPTEDRQAAEIARALGHPLRIGYLRALRELGPEGMLSPSEHARESGEPLGNVAYHVKALREAGVLEIGENVARRGAREHRYSLSGPRAKVTAAAMRELANT
jgi:DNA-binding transcriptional ArsR family regulator